MYESMTYYVVTIEFTNFGAKENNLKIYNLKKNPMSHIKSSE